jgi:hypothetical protein
MTDHNGTEVSNPDERRKWADDAIGDEAGPDDAAPHDRAEKPTTGADPDTDASGTTELRDELESIRAIGEDR